MTTRRFFVENLAPDARFVDLPDREAHHLFATLRGQPGDEVELLDGRGHIAAARVGNDKTLEILEVKTIPGPPTRVVLYLSPPRKKLMDQALRQCAEAGVAEIRPIETERAVALPENPATLERWRWELIEACKQSRNPFLPEVFPLTSFGEAIGRVEGEKLPIAFGEAGGGSVSVFARAFSTAPGVALFIGPEGGFSPAETDRLRQAGATALSFGLWTFRVETAATVGVAMLLTAFREAK